MRDHLIIQGVKMILRGLEIPPDNRHYIKTPWRVLETFKEIFAPTVEFPGTYEENYNEMITMRHHRAWTLCPHHLLPVHLDISVSYVPNGRVIGLSKMARIAHSVMDGPVIQEELTDKIADAIMQNVNPSPMGSACVIVGQHMCMQMRGVKTAGDVVTSAMRGIFLSKPEARAEFLAMVRR